MVHNVTAGVMLYTMLFLAHQQQENSSIDLLYHLPEGMEAADLTDVKCYGVYGCFPLSGPWTSELRPFGYYPKSPEQLNMRFPVFNRNTQNLPKFIDINDPDFVHEVGINPNGMIYLVTHGYLETGTRPWIQRMVDALLEQDKHGTASVIVIDWGEGSAPPYTQSVGNCRLAGAITAHVLHLVYEELGLPNMDKVHLIGHSLGAHLCGYAGYTLQRDFNLTVGRITGLDPAEPLFRDTDPIVRLDRTDAKFVDIIHTDGMPFYDGGLGMTQAIGHVDFYPNGGYDQPGCAQPIEDYIQMEKGSFFWGVQQFVSCNHLRSYQFFIESIFQRCPFMAISCESYEKFKRGECFKCGGNGGQHCLSFGFDAHKSYRHHLQNGLIQTSTPIKAYLMTNPISPFCRNHYRLSMVISNSTESIMHGGEIGIMSIIIHSSRSGKKTEKVALTEAPIHYVPGGNYTTIFPASEVGIPKFAEFNWEYKTNPLNPLTWRILASPRVYIDYIVLESMEHKSKIRLCPANGSPVVSDHSSEFKQEYCDYILPFPD